MVSFEFEPLDEGTRQSLPSDHQVAEKPTEVSKAALNQVEYEHPVVKEVVEIFNGSITDIRT